LRFASVLRRCLVGLVIAYAVALAAIVAARVAFPFEIEWMEGGMLTHAVRLRLGQPIYAPPSADFVAFFYTPLYPMLLAGLSALGIPLGFALGRAVSVLATAATMALLYAIASREAGRTWGVFAACLYAAFFRFAGAFYDVARPDSLAMALALASAAVAAASYRTRARGLAAVAGLLIVAAFFTKQTTAVFAPAIAIALATRRWTVGAVFASTVAAAGALGVWIADRASGGWFWFYVAEGHQGHLFLWKNIALEYWRDVLFLAPALLLVPLLALAYGRVTRWGGAAFVLFLSVAFAQRAATLDYPEHMYYRELWYESPRVLVLVPPLVMAALLCGARFAAHRPPRVSGYWLWMAAAGAVASALNHSTQWAYANCFMPLAVFGSLAAALTLSDFVERGGAAAAMAAAAVIVQLVALAYDPRAQVPSRADVRALALLRRRVADAAARGPVLIPSHPWLAFEASGKTNLHQMSIGDVAFHGGVADLTRRIAHGEWPTVIVDENTSVPDLDRTMYVSDRFSYARDELLSKTGFRVRPLTVWRLQDPAERQLAPGITGNFEGSTYAGWTATGGAFGERAATRTELQAIAGMQGQRAASSRGSAGGGFLESAPFVLDAPRITLLVAGSTGTYVRAMHDDDEVARVQPVDAVGLSPRSLDVGRWVGQRIRIQVVDETKTEAAGEEHPGIVVDDFRVAW
jgi:hypothetical protein